MSKQTKQTARIGFQDALERKYPVVLLLPQSDNFSLAHHFGHSVSADQAPMTKIKDWERGRHGRVMRAYCKQPTSDLDDFQSKIKEIEQADLWANLMVGYEGRMTNIGNFCLQSKTVQELQVTLADTHKRPGDTLYVGNELVVGFPRKIDGEISVPYLRENADGLQWKNLDDVCTYDQNGQALINF